MNNKYTIVRNTPGDRAVKLHNGNIVPADIAALCTGKDLWLSQIICKCRDCKQPFTLNQLHGNGQWCEQCQTADIDAVLA